MATVKFPLTLWDDKSAQTTLSNGDLTATNGVSTSLHETRAGPNGAVNLGIGGRWYCEITLDVFSDSTTSWGVRSIADGGSPGLRLGNFDYSCCLRNAFGGGSTSVRSENVELSTGHGATAQGDVIQIAYNAFDGLVWFGINNTWVEGDPGAGTGASVTDFFPVESIVPAYTTSSDSDAVTFNFGASAFAYAPPTAFVGWEEMQLPTGYLLNEFDSENATVVNGGRTLTDQGPGGAGVARANRALPPTGKFYWEVTIDTGGTVTVGACSPTYDITGTTVYFGEDTLDGWSYTGSNGRVYVNGTLTTGFATTVTGDVVGCAYDADAGSAWISINGVQIQGDPDAGTSPPITGVGTWRTFIALGVAGIGTVNFDPLDFEYQPPVDFAPLNRTRNPDRVWLVEAQVHDGTNGELLADPDFDGDSPGWTLSGTAALSVGTLKITSQAEANRAEQTVSVTNADTYELRLWVRECQTDVLTVPCTIGIEFGDASTDGSKTEIMAQAHGWVRHAGVFGATHTIKIYISETGSGTGYYLSVDHASLRLVADFETLYFGTHDYVTRSTDTPASTRYSPRLISDLSFSQSVDIVDSAGPQVARDVGVLQIANTDGALDQYLSRSWAGRPVTIRTVTRGEPITSAITVVAGLISSVSSTDDSVTLVVADRSADLERLFPLTRYLGTAADSEGGAEVLGRPKPIALGNVQMVAPLLINQTSKKYQATAWPNQGTVAVYDGGVALTRITAGSPTAGQFLDEYGALTLGSDPTYLLVANGASLARVDYDAGPAALASMTKISEILRNLAARWGEFDDPEDMDLSIIESLPALSDHAVEAYISGQASLAAIISSLVRAIPGIWGFTRGGRFFFRRVSAPVSPLITYRDADIVSVRRTQSLEPAWRVSVEHSRTHTLHAPNDIAAGATDAIRQQISRQFETATISSSSVRRSSPLARDLEFSFPIDKTGADIAAADLLALHGVRRDYVIAEVREDPGALNIGEVIALSRTRRPTTWNKPFLIIGIDERSTSPLVTLRLWG